MCNFSYYSIRDTLTILVFVKAVNIHCNASWRSSILVITLQVKKVNVNKTNVSWLNL